jgi:NUC153 domain
LCATDQPKLEAYYVPKVGLAPSWCSFLENVTEELEERDLKRETAGGTSSSSDVLVRDGQETIFENYKFVSRDDLEKLGVSDLIGTPLLKAYMHGFFMDINLYNKVRAVANPFEYEEYRKKKLKERLEAKRASRIAPKASGDAKKTMVVNPDLAERLQHKSGSNTKSGKVAQGLLADSRFGTLFSNPDFEIDEEDENFKLRNPSGVAAMAIKRKRRDDLDSDDDDYSNEDDNDPDDGLFSDANRNKQHSAAGFRRVYDDDEDEDDSRGDADNCDFDDSDSGSGSEDDDGFRGGKVRGEAYQEVKDALRGGKKTSRKQKTAMRKDDWSKKAKKAVMFEADDIGDASNVAVQAVMGESSAARTVQDKIRRMNMPLEKRFQMEEVVEPTVKVINKKGSKEIHYVPKDTRGMTTKQTVEDDEHDGTGGRSRRSAKGLGNNRFQKR